MGSGRSSKMPGYQFSDNPRAQFDSETGGIKDDILKLLDTQTAALREQLHRNLAIMESLRFGKEKRIVEKGLRDDDDGGDHSSPNFPISIRHSPKILKEPCPQKTSKTLSEQKFFISASTGKCAFKTTSFNDIESRQELLSSIRFFSRTDLKEVPRNYNEQASSGRQSLSSSGIDSALKAALQARSLAMNSDGEGDDASSTASSEEVDEEWD